MSHTTHFVSSLRSNDYSALGPEGRAAARSTAPVSIVIPTYNRAGKLARTLAAATHLDAPVGGLEVVVADDGSSDETHKVVREFEPYLSITHLRQGDRGHRLAEVTNLGIRAARHERIILLQSDMLPSPGLVAAYGAWLDLTEDVLLIGMRRFTCSDHLTPGEILADSHFDERLPDIRTRNGMWSVNGAGVMEDWRLELYRRTDWLKDEVSPFRAVVGSNLAFYRNVALRLGGFCEAFRSWGGEDGEFGYRAYIAGLHLVPVRDAVAFHQEPPFGINETNRQAGFAVSRVLREQLCPLPPFRRPRAEAISPFAVPKVVIGSMSRVAAHAHDDCAVPGLDARVVKLSTRTPPCFTTGGTTLSSCEPSEAPARLLTALAASVPAAPYLLLTASGNAPPARLVGALLGALESGPTDALISHAPEPTLLVSARAWNRAATEITRRCGEAPFPNFIPHLGACLNLRPHASKILEIPNEI